MPAPLLPPAFRLLGILRILNVVSVGFARDAVSSSVGDVFLGSRSGVIVGVPTVLCGVLWALLLRIRKTIGRSPVRWSWLASFPLAATNAALACGILFATGPSENDMVKPFTSGAFLGATFGAIVWIPALVATFVCFGLPLWRGHRLAEQGLAGEERGERVVAIAASVMALLGLMSGPLIAKEPSEPNVVLEWGPTVALAFGAIGLLTGLLAAVLAHLRALRRRDFVAQVEAGTVAGYRVADAPEGRVLMRITSLGAGYRVADFEEPVYAEAPDSDGDRARVMRGPHE